MGLQRRDFFKIAATGSAAVLVGKVSASTEGEAQDFRSAHGVLVDTVVCIGCRKCEWACNDENELPTQELKAFEDKSVFAKHRRPDKAAYTVVNKFTDPAAAEKQFTMKVQCMHCNDPACASACIVGALKKEASGPVTYDAWKCIGCRYCMVACPFQIPAYEYNNALDPQVRKCTFCYDRITKDGKKPACVSICPNEALTFGTREQLLDVAYQRMQNFPERYTQHVYGEHEAGGTSWLYLAPCDFKQTELPKLSDEVIPHKTESIQHGIFKSFLPPLALYGLLGLIMYTKRHDADEEEDTNENA